MVKRKSSDSTANSANNKLTPWQPGQSGNPSGRPKGTLGLANYVQQATHDGKELVDTLLAIARGALPQVAEEEDLRRRKNLKVRPADQLKAIEILLGRGFGRSPQQLAIAYSISERPLEHLSDATLQMVVENARQLEESSGAVVDGEGKVAGGVMI